jgi:hypothetical protein
MAFTYDRLENLLLAYLQRKSHGILPAWCTNHGPTTSIYYRDPDGNTIETQVDNTSDVEAINAMMLSEELRENPIGVDFEPEDLIRRIKEGESLESLVFRPNIGPRGVESLPASMLA